MARIVALVPDLLFGSRVKSALESSGHEVELIGEPDLAEKLEGASLLIVDLTDPDLDGSEIVRALIEKDALKQTPTLGFYSHVDPQTRKRAEEAGFDLVVPRSRMAREGAQLVNSLLAGS